MLKRILALTLALVLCCGFAACDDSETTAQNADNGGQEAPSAEAEYTVKVVDALGNLYTGTALVRFMQDGQQKAMQQAAEGVVTKTLPRGEYALTLELPDCQQEFVYEETKVTATETAAELKITYKLGAETTELYASETPVHFVTEGCTVVPVTAGQRTYFLFNLERAGKFSFTTIGGGTVGYYGAPHMVQDYSAIEVVNNVFDINIKEGHIGGQPLVIGIDSDTDADVTLCITRVGDPDWGVEDEPVQSYQAKETLSPYTLPAGAKLKDFDLTAESYTLVKDEQGFYHLDSVDGPLVLTYLTVKSKYLDPLKTVSEKSKIGKVFWNEAGVYTKESFQKQEVYNDCVNAYCAVADEKAGVYPLTDDLMYILQQHGDYYGWWDTESHSYLFKDADGMTDTTINPDVAWLFACCYIA